MLFSQKVDYFLALAGTVIPLFSIVSSGVIQYIRMQLEDGSEVSKGLLRLASFLNVVSVNLDKAAHLRKMAKGAAKPQVEPEVVVEAEGTSAVEVKDEEPAVDALAALEIRVGVLEDKVAVLQLGPVLPAAPLKGVTAKKKVAKK